MLKGNSEATANIILMQCYTDDRAIVHATFKDSDEIPTPTENKYENQPYVLETETHIVE